uniref:non-specific protein-tyrosine kinase n=1 Tax=Timema bartmani TaxID=61472 RepID=A0A7R9I0I0_9NEOP|nr:unnamed protein product [Timema bartmani]
MRIRLSLDNVISAPKWYFGKIKRIEAEKKLLLPENDHGAFLIRDSESRRNDYSLSVRDGDTVKHYRIRQLDEGGFFIARRTTFRTLQELVEHYSKDADGLCVNLRKPCIRFVMTVLIYKGRDSKVVTTRPTFFTSLTRETNKEMVGAAKGCASERRRMEANKGGKIVEKKWK